MLFKDLHIRNFRGFESIDVEDLSNINLFLGHNNSGKTSILESIFLLIGMSNPELNIKINNFRDFAHNESEDFKLIFHNFNIEKSIDISSNLYDNSARGLTISPVFKKSNDSNGLRTIDIDSESSSSSLSNVPQTIKGLRLHFFNKKFHKPKTSSKSEISIEDGRIKAEIARDYKEEYFGAFINSKSSFTDVPSRVEKIIKNKKEKEQLYPLKFTPIIKDKIWGGTKLKDLLHKNITSDKAGESWEISGVAENISVVSEGFLEGNSLQDLLEVYMGDLVGQKVFDWFGTDFPLLIKYIDAADDLSIQVHPNDEKAAERHNSFGKTEMWYVMQADKGSKLISGFSKKIKKNLFLEKLEQNKLLGILNQEPVEYGDVFFIPAGRIHAIGKGCLIAEIQQTSDITYRVYDFDRKDDKGNPRELHTDLAVDIIDYNYCGEYKTNYQHTLNKPSCLIECNYFTTNIIEIEDAVERDMIAFDSFVIYMCIEGSAEIVVENEVSTFISKGETVLVPAEISHYYLQTEEKAKLLEVYISLSENEDQQS
jgi:mannose-6-phosphate isomerase